MHADKAEEEVGDEGEEGTKAEAEDEVEEDPGLSQDGLWLNTSSMRNVYRQRGQGLAEGTEEQVRRTVRTNRVVFKPT